MKTKTHTDPSAEGVSWQQLGENLVQALHLTVAPIAITFEPDVPADPPLFDAPMSEPAPDGRRGRVPASCVFWVRGTERSFTTLPEDHGNCSVGLYTHGLSTLEELSGKGDVEARFGSGWVTPELAGSIPSLSQSPAAITYGPLGQAPGDPDVVLIRVNGRQMMIMADAVHDMTIEGKPQCHIVALAKQSGKVAASVGCALSRARTGMRPDEMTCAIPGPRLAEVTVAVKRAAGVDSAVARYAAQDARRFSG